MRKQIVAALFLLAAQAAAQEELSTIAVPIRTTLAPLVPLVEAQVPARLADTIDQRGYTVSYEVTRDPIRLQMIGAGLHATTTAHYSVEACPLRFRCLSCGIDERKRDAVITLHSHFTWDRSWRLRSSTQAQPAYFPNRCRVSMLAVDVTDRFIAPIVDGQLRDVAQTIDRNTPSLTDIQPIARDLWRTLQDPVEIAPRTFLVFEPLTAALGPVSGAGLQVTSTLTLRARTRVVVGAKPAPPSTPLPSLVNGESAGGLRVPFDIELPYAEAGQLATEEFGHRSYKIEGDTLRIDAIRIGPGSAGRIGLTADIRTKRYSGPVTLEGTPRFDPATRSVIVPDLDYSVETKKRSLFFKIGEKIAHEGVRGRLRESARWPLKEQIALVSKEIDEAMNRTISPGVTMRGQVGAIEPQRVTSAANGLVVRVVVTGSATIDVTARPAR